MYKKALGAMGLRWFVRIVGTVGFPEMTISPRDAVWQLHELCPILNILLGICIEIWSMYQIALSSSSSSSMFIFNTII